LERLEKSQIDYFLIAIIILLIGVGITILFSASYYHADKLGRDPQYFFHKQLIWLVLGSLAAFISSRLSLSLLKKLIPLIILFALGISFFPFIPTLGKSINNARRWIFFFDYSFQPSELVKFALILYLAYILSKKQKKIDNALNTILPPFVVVLIFVGVTFLQNDLSTAAFIMFIALSMFFIAKVPLVYFFYLGTTLIPLGIIIFFTKTYWVEKLMIFFNPQRDPQGAGYQIIASRATLINGGLLGRGWGMGIQKKYVPEADSDFIFSVAGEEMGFLGLIFIIILYLFFAVRGYKIALKSKDYFTFYLAFGITSSIFIQALLNMFVVTGLMPATGIPLPFFSLGGSSILMTLIMCGLLINLSRMINKKSEALYG